MLQRRTNCQAVLTGCSSHKACRSRLIVVKNDSIVFLCVCTILKVHNSVYGIHLLYNSFMSRVACSRHQYLATQEQTSLATVCKLSFDT